MALSAGVRPSKAHTTPSPDSQPGESFMAEGQMTKRTRILTMLLATSLCSSFSVRAQGTPPLRRVDLRLDSLVDSGSYLVYAYRIVNARESRGGAAVLSLDVSAPRGTGFPTLPATGRVDHRAGYPCVAFTRFLEQAPVCRSLRTKFHQEAQPGNRDASKRGLRALLEELEAQHGPEKPVNDNAYWLLKANGEYLLAHM